MHWVERVWTFQKYDGKLKKSQSSSNKPSVWFLQLVPTDNAQTAEWTFFSAKVYPGDKRGFNNTILSDESFSITGLTEWSGWKRKKDKQAIHSTSHQVKRKFLVCCSQPIGWTGRWNEKQSECTHTHTHPPIFPLTHTSTHTSTLTTCMHSLCLSHTHSLTSINYISRTHTLHHSHKQSSHTQRGEIHKAQRWIMNIPITLLC